jgi:hypothetical protein
MVTVYLFLLTLADRPCSVDAPQELNMTHTIDDLRCYLNRHHATPVANQMYKLQDAAPPRRVYADGHQTLQSAGLNQARLIQAAM